MGDVFVMAGWREQKGESIQAAPALACPQGNERWHVREVEYNGTTFWTTLSREPITNS